MDRRPKAADIILFGAAALVERRGLARQCLQDEAGRVCTVRALQAQVLGSQFQVPWWDDPAVNRPAEYCRALTAVRDFLGWPNWQLPQMVEDQLIAWSDSVAADAAQVAEVLRGSAALVYVVAVPA